METFEDNVGNDGEASTVDLVIDTAGPKIEKLEIYGYSDVGDKNYFQSNDQIKILMTATEISGLVVLLDLDDVVNDAKTLYLEDMYTRDLGDGWLAFTEDNCNRVEGKWECEFLTEGIRSGPAAIKLKMKVQDTAGNDASVWPDTVKNAEKIIDSKDGAVIHFDVLGLSTEDNPNYWEVDGRPKSLLSFVDLDAAQITNSKAPFKVTFEPNDHKVKALKMELVDCAPKEVTLSKVGPKDIVVAADSAPTLRRSLIYGGNFIDGESSPVVNLILEFDPFEAYSQLGIPANQDFEEAFAEYLCRMKIFSKVGKDALQVAELQDVILPVSFSFSTLGAVDESLKKKIKDIKGSDFMKFADAFSWADIVVKWLNWGFNILQIIVTVSQFATLFSESFVMNAKVVEETATGSVVGASFGVKIGLALRGQCMVVDQSQESMWTFIKYIQIPLQILNCNPQPGIDLGPYGWWQKQVLDAYNLASGRGPLGVPATSLYENMYASGLGLCVPGILYNVNKAREVHCRKIICYGREVPAGIATMEACDQLYDLQMCEFVWGPAFDFAIFGGMAYIGKMLKAAFSSPLGYITIAEVLVCGAICFADYSPEPGKYTACKVLTGIDKVLTIINSIISSIESRPDVTGSPYCKIAESIDLDELVPGGEEEVAYEDATAVSEPAATAPVPKPEPTVAAEEATPVPTPEPAAEEEE